MEEAYKESIIRMVNSMTDVVFLKRIYTFVLHMWKR
jgi:hypothetical protein